MNYKIILDEGEFMKFVDFLPELEDGECYYVSLFARKKYHPSAKNDKSQCKRFTATTKEWLVKKVRQLEIEEGRYTNKDGSPVHNDALALYISINPRSFFRAQRDLLKRLASSVADHCVQNPTAMAYSELQKAKSRTIFVDFDFDDIKFEETELNLLLPEGTYSILETRGGFHLLIRPDQKELKGNWYTSIKKLTNCDVTGDTLIPVPGCTQGGFIPRLKEAE